MVGFDIIHTVGNGFRSPSTASPADTDKIQTTVKGVKMIKFCKKCQVETDRSKTGSCKFCDRLRHNTWKAANTEKLKSYQAAYRVANYEESVARARAYYAANKEKINAAGAVWHAKHAVRQNSRRKECYDKNKGRHKAVMHRWYLANKDKVIADTAARRAANPERTKELSKAAYVVYHAVNKEKINAAGAAYRAANPEQVRAAITTWRKNNPEACRVHGQNRRAREHGNGGALSKGLIKKLFAEQNGMCPCCAQPLGEDYHMDHIMPLALGGANEDSNMQLLRAVCNMKKGSKHPDVWAQERILVASRAAVC